MFKIKNIKVSRVTIALSLLFLCSCSTSFTYNNLTWLSSFWVDDYIDLNKQQNKQLKSIINTTQQWHRTTQLPAYKQDILNLKGLFNQQLDYQQLKSQVVLARAHFQNILEHAHIPLAQLGLTLSYAQREELIANIQTQINEEYEEFNELTAQERKSERLERQLDYYKQWLGKLTPVQTQLITQANNAHYDSSLLWHQYKQTRLNAAQQVLLNKALSEAEFVKQLSYVITQREAYMSEELLASNDANLALYVNLLIELNTTLSEQQRESVNDEFDELIYTLTDLIED
ncbi:MULTISPECIES: DUF6279 family lipoprotein [unclassified Pseudoalteromonas]|uniref:DUF6279 family lipoprotein n=1 Tax=unclassified Pseudoalteromonas TaxID=194690 RepID=UPI002580FE1C|nr:MULTISPECIES: DUF6279 family lipoprotein [unclassified Pseudoalteromonas]|tara:strand:+ start:10600 stop:11460 length:861 start_codon:yes stop_codon:yes gene_type:complete